MQRAAAADGGHPDALHVAREHRFERRVVRSPVHGHGRAELRAVVQAEPEEAHAGRVGSYTRQDVDGIAVGQYLIVGEGRGPFSASRNVPQSVTVRGTGAWKTHGRAGEERGASPSAARDEDVSRNRHGEVPQAVVRL
jgi:hypothetical protein